MNFDLNNRSNNMHYKIHLIRRLSKEHSDSIVKLCPSQIRELKDFIQNIYNLFLSGIDQKISILRMVLRCELQNNCQVFRKEMEGIFNIVFDNLRLKINPESEAYCEQHNRINLAMAGAKLPIEREQRKVQKDFEKRIELFKTEQNDKFKDYMKDLNESLKQLEIETKRGARGMTALLQQLINNAAERRNSCTKDQFDKEVTSIVMQAKDFKKEQTCNLLQNLDKAEQTFLEKIYEMEMEAMKKFQDLKLDILNEIRSLYYIMFQGTNQLQLDLSEFRQQ